MFSEQIAAVESPLARIALKGPINQVRSLQSIYEPGSENKIWSADLLSTNCAKLHDLRGKKEEDFL